MLIGITRGTTRAHIVKAVLESLAQQTADVIESLPQEIQRLRVDGGASENQWLMQFQSDILNKPIDITTVTETTALGVAMLAGESVGLWTTAQTKLFQKVEKTLFPSIKLDTKKRLRRAWKEAVKRSLSWSTYSS